MITSLRFSDRQLRLSLFGLCVLVLGSAVGSRYPWHIDETRFVGVALEMLQRGDFWVPHRAGQIYADKPPIFFWTLALFFKLTDSVRWTFLLPAFISGVVTTQLVYDLGTRLWNRRIGFVAGVLLILTYQFWRSCTYANIDGFLLMWPTLALYGFIRHLLSGHDSRWFYLGFFALAVGILSKGVGFLPLLIAIPYALLRTRWRHANLAHRAAIIPGRQWLLGVLLLLALLAMWLLPLLWMAQQNTGDIRAYLDNILLKQTAGRYANAWQHREPAWFFLASIPKYWAPVSLLLPWLLPAWWRRWRRGDARYVLLLGWVMLVLAFFSASTGKREIYMLPALPALILAAAPTVAVLLSKRWLQRAALAAAALLIVLPAIAAALRLAQLHSRLEEWPQQAAFALLAVAALNAVLFVFLRRHHAAIGFAVIYALTIATYHKGLVPLLDAKESGRAPILALSAAAGPEPLVALQWDERFWLYNTTTMLHGGMSSTRCAAAHWSQAHPQSRWLIRETDSESFGVGTGATFASGDKRRWMLVAPNLDMTGCENSGDPAYRFRWSEESLRRLSADIRP